MNTIKESWLTNGKALAKYAQKTAEGLIYELNIDKKGKQLPWVLGMMDSADNFDALTPWIGKQILINQLSQQDAPNFIRIKLSSLFLDSN